MVRTSTQPNILFIFIDDMGWRDLSGFGSAYYESPCMDALMARGTKFSNAYAACPVCSPSRASYMTGKYPARLHLTDWIDELGNCHPLRGKVIDAPYIKHLPETEYALPQALHDGGYQTWHIGKWHLGGQPYTPERFGYDVNIGGCWWGHPQYGYFSPYHNPALSDGPDGEYLTDRLTDEAISLLERSGDQPFFMSYCAYAVHTPIQAKPDDVAYFTEKARRLGIDAVQALVPGEFFPFDMQHNERIMRRVIQSDPTYAAMVWNLDQNIGRLVAALERLGKLDNTLIIFTSDNGGDSTSAGSPTCNLPAIEGKGWMYEGGTRVPLWALWDGHTVAGAVCEAPVSTIDYYPTLLEAAGIGLRAEQTVDGVSIVPLLEGREIGARAIYWHYPHYGNQGGTPGGSVLWGDYKLIEFFEDMRSELYNVREDLSETHNLAEALPGKREELLGLLHAWQRDVGAAFPVRLCGG